MSTPSTPLIPQTWAPGSSWVWKAGALFVTAGMIAGAFGAHGLRRKTNITAEGLQAWGSASSYAVYNGLGLLLISLHPRFSGHRFAAPAILTGGITFSGSIIALVLARDRFKFLGPITPLGGMLMIAGWVSSFYPGKHII